MISIQSIRSNVLDWGYLIVEGPSLLAKGKSPILMGGEKTSNIIEHLGICHFSRQMPNNSPFFGMGTSLCYIFASQRQGTRCRLVAPRDDFPTSTLA